MPNIGARDRGLGGKGGREKGFCIYKKISWRGFRTSGIKNYVKMSTFPEGKISPRPLLWRAKNHRIIFVPRLDSRALCKIEARVKRLGGIWIWEERLQRI